MRRIIDEQYAVALTILKENRALLEETAARLLVDEVIEGAALKTLAAAVGAAKDTASAEDASEAVDGIAA